MIDETDKQYHGCTQEELDHDLWMTGNIELMGKLRELQTCIREMLNDRACELDDEIQELIEDKMSDARDEMEAMVSEYIDHMFEGELDLYDLEELSFDLEEEIQEAIDNNRMCW